LAERDEPQVRYAFMAIHQTEFRIEAMSRALAVSRSGYYGWVQRQTRGPSPCEQARRSR
jgi:hypothetical protein